MAVNRVPVIKRCRSLDMDPSYLGLDKKSKRKALNAGRKLSDYGYAVKRKAESKVHLRCS